MFISSITISIDVLLHTINKYEFEEQVILTEVLFVVSGLIALCMRPMLFSLVWSRLQMLRGLFRAVELIHTSGVLILVL